MDHRWWWTIQQSKVDDAQSGATCQEREYHNIKVHRVKQRTHGCLMVLFLMCDDTGMHNYSVLDDLFCNVWFGEPCSFLDLTKVSILTHYYK